MQWITTQSVKGLGMTSDSPDELLVQEAQKGNRDAFMELYWRYHTIVSRRVASRVPGFDVDDVTQDIFIGLIEALKGFRGQSRFSVWLYTIVNRRIADYYRSRQRRHDSALSLDDTNTPQIASEEEIPEEDLLLQKALRSLPEHYQEILLLRFADDLPFAQIADLRGQSLEATKSLYRRALEALKEQMKKG